MFAALRHPPGPRARPEDRPGGGASTRAHPEVGPLGPGEGGAPVDLQPAEPAGPPPPRPRPARRQPRPGRPGGRRGEAPGQLRQAEGGGAGGGDGLGRRCPQHHSQLIILVCMDFSNNN